MRFVAVVAPGFAQGAHADDLPAEVAFGAPCGKQFYAARFPQKFLAVDLSVFADEPDADSVEGAERFRPFQPDRLEISLSPQMRCQ